jgi:hypothetical protein
VITLLETVVKVKPRAEAWPFVTEADPVIPLTKSEAEPEAKVIKDVEVVKVNPDVAPYEESTAIVKAAVPELVDTLAKLIVSRPPEDPKKYVLETFASELAGSATLPAAKVNDTESLPVPPTIEAPVT